MPVESPSGFWKGWTITEAGDRVPGSPSTVPADAPREGVEAATVENSAEASRLRSRIEETAFAFRGYDVSNQGRSHELLRHPIYGPVVRASLDEASVICAEAMGVRVDLADRVDRLEPSSLATYAMDAATIIAMELAQLRLLESCFDVPIRRARLSFGYSIGEATALMAGGVYAMDQLLPVLLRFASDAADLTADTTMGILLCRGPRLPFEAVDRLCRIISGEGRGLVGPSALLSPNAALLIGQGETLDRLEQAMAEQLSVPVTLRRKPNRWPPLHTPLVWRRSIPNRVAVALHEIAGGIEKPVPTVISGVTGEASYTDWNSREMLVDWTDHPQRLWDVVGGALASGVQLVIHVGPAPNLIPATFDRLTQNIVEQMKRRHLHHLGNRLIPGISRRGWLTRLLPGEMSLLRAPFVDHLILEDWLLGQEIPGRLP